MYDEKIPEGNVTHVLQLRANRRHALAAVMSGANVREGDSPPRWDGDQGHPMKLEEKAFWTDAQTAWQQTTFEHMDAAYELAKVDL